jgi:DNA primase
MEKHSIADYLEHIGAKVPSRGGGWRKMRCPFHDDSNASASINFDANRFKCFGCGVSGDTYDLIQHDKGGTLSEAIEFASTISTTSDATIRIPHRGGSRVSINKTSLGRRGSSFSSGSGRRSTTGA